ncbi:cytochrome P450 monooxygenase pc-3 [Clavulina sp. PMI_390]|nr:cytochrome P450 monooxygenase pc-3 [Clavulina sp. PMI_390]
MKLTPGISYLLNILPSLVAPPLLVYAVLVRLSAAGIFTALDSRSWLRFLVVFLAIPATLYARDIWKEVSDRSRARKLGARMLPQVRGRWYIPADIDLLVHLITADQWDYADNPLEELLKTHGKTITIRAMGDRKVLTKEPRHIKQILAGNFDNYVKGDELFGEATRAILGVGVFNSDGAMWKFHRNLARPFFTRDRISDFNIFEKHTDAVIEIMKSSFSSGTPLDIQDLCSRFALDSATEFLFGESAHSIYEPLLLPGGLQPPSPQLPSTEPSRPSSASFVKALRDAQENIAMRVLMGKVWPLSEIFHDKSDDYTVPIRAYLEPILERALLKRTQLLKERDAKGLGSDGQEKESIEEGMTLLDHLVLETDDRNIIRDSLMNMLIAGRDTTATLLTFSLYFLSQHSDVLAKLRKEIMDTIGPIRRPTPESMREVKYLRAILNETLRLFPSVPFNYRQAVKEDVWTDDDGTRWFIPAGTDTCYTVMYMHRDKDLWGEDALEFDPMRWIDERLSKLTANPFMFLPFNAGPRICLGQQLAYNEASFFIIRLLQTFETITLRPDAQPQGTLPNSSGKWDLSAGRNGIEKVWPRTCMIMFVEGGMWGVMGLGNDVSI